MQNGYQSALAAWQHQALWQREAGEENEWKREKDSESQDDALDSSKGAFLAFDRG